MKSKTILVVLGALALVSCSHSVAPEQAPITKVDQPFAAAGSIEMQLESGDYVIRASRGEHVRVSFSGNTGNAAADWSASGTHANLAIRETPKSNFRATVEVPKTGDLTIHLTAGNLEVESIAGNKEIDSKAGNVSVSVPNTKDYGTVEASVKVGDLKAGPFGQSESGISPHLKWSGTGKYTLRVSLGAGNLELKQ